MHLDVDNSALMHLQHIIENLNLTQNYSKQIIIAVFRPEQNNKDACVMFHSATVKY